MSGGGGGGVYVCTGLLEMGRGGRTHPPRVAHAPSEPTHRTNGEEDEMSVGAGAVYFAYGDALLAKVRLSLSFVSLPCVCVCGLARLVCVCVSPLLFVAPYTLVCVRV